MKRNIALLLVVIALALVGAWYGLAVDPAPTPRAEPAAEEGPIAVTNDAPDHEVIAPARPATPEPAPGEQAAPAQPAATPAHAEPAAPMTELESLEARWRELRRQGHWNEAAPLWEEIKQLRAAAEPEAPKAPEPQPFDETKGAWAPAEPWIPPRKDMLPDPLPGGSRERIPTSKSTGSIAGQVVDDAGKPVPGALLILREVPGDDQAKSYRSDDLGAFQIDSVEVGVYRLSALCAGHIAADSLVNVEANVLARPMRALVLARMARVKLQLVSAGQPVHGRTFTLRLFDETGRQCAEADAVASEDGTVVFQVSCHDATEFMLFHRRYSPCSKQRCLLRPGEEFDGGKVYLTAADDD